MKIAIIKYNAGNIQSVLFALERIGVKGTVTENRREIEEADKVIFPGVGEASSAMQYLHQRGLDELILSLKQPLLGICLGMQMLCNYSEENDTRCLGVFDTSVRKFRDPSLKVPQIGWNSIKEFKGPLFRGISNSAYCYFVHSYYAGLCDQTIAKTEYGIEFSSALSKDNFYGVQFHSEKSSGVGEQIIKNFISL